MFKLKIQGNSFQMNKIIKSILALSLMLFSSSALAKKTTLKLSHYFAESHPQHIALKAFAEEIKKETNGEINVKIFPNAQLGSEEQMINGTRNGTIEVSLIGSLMQNLDFKLGFTETPFLMRDYEHAKHVLDSDIGSEIAAAFEPFGVKHLAYSVSGFRVVSSNKKIEKPEDYKGVRMRVPNVQTFVEMANLLGVNGQTMAFTEVFTALEQGVVDAQENPMSLIKAQGFYEVQKYIMETNHMFTNLNLMMNKKAYDKLSDAHKKIIGVAAQNYKERSWKLVVEDNEKTRQFFIDHGVEVLTPSAEFTKWNQDAMAPLYEKLYEKYDWAEGYVERIKAQ